MTTLTFKETYQWLGYAGLVPFVVFCVGSYVTHPLVSYVSLLGFVSYSLLICSFLTGSLWGQVIHRSNLADRRLLLISNLLSLCAWCSFLLFFFIPLAAILLLGILFLAVYFVEPSLAPERDSKEVYASMRQHLSVLVALLHGVVAIGFA